MVDAQTKSKQIVAVGLNRRGNLVYQKLAKEVPAGKIGKVTVARAARINNMFPSGIGKLSLKNHQKTSIGICGSVHALTDLTSIISHLTSSAGGTTTRARWATGVFITWT